MIYLDTSAVVALLTLEPESDRVDEWLSGETDLLVSSDWLAVEFASALAAKLRARALRSSQVKSAMEAFNEFSQAGLRMLPVSRVAYLEAARLCGTKGMSLRAGDALHLAAAMEAGAKALAGLDATMNASARQLGLAVVP